MGTKSLQIIGLLVLAGAALHSQPTTGAQYWSTTMPNCSSLNQTPVEIKDASGTTVGYSCYVTGTFAWLAAGGGWTTHIRAAAPASGAIGVDYTFYDKDGNDLNVDAAMGSSATIQSGNDVNFSLNANQPSEVHVMGATNDAPGYNSSATGSVYAIFYCPSASTCLDVLPQLIYSALPAIPWSLSVPIAWDDAVWTQWSALGVDDGGSHLISFVVYNESTTATAFTIRVYDSTGALAATGTTPVVQPLRQLGNGFLGEGGTYGALLKDVVQPLPPGIFKVHIDGGSNYCAVAVLQFDAGSGTALQVAYDSAAGSSATAGSALSAAPASRVSARRAQSAARPRTVFAPLAY